MSELKLNKEILAALENCKDPKEVMALAKTKGIDLNEEQAAKLFACTHNEELTDEELEQVVGGMRQTGAALNELLNRSKTIPSEIMDNILSNNPIGGTEGYSRQKVNEAAVMPGIV